MSMAILAPHIGYFAVSEIVHYFLLKSHVRPMRHYHIIFINFDYVCTKRTLQYGVEILRKYLGHLLGNIKAIFGYFNYISVSIYLKLLKVSLNSCADHDKNTMKYSVIRTIWGPYQLYLHARVIFELC